MLATHPPHIHEAKPETAITEKLIDTRRRQCRLSLSARLTRFFPIQTHALLFLIQLPHPKLLTRPLTRISVISNSKLLPCVNP
jgi:hypothetical protein